MQPLRIQYTAPDHPPPLPLQPKSNLDNFIEHFIATQTKTNEALNEFINQLTSKFDIMASPQKAMETQIAHIAQLVSYLSRP